MAKTKEPKITPEQNAKELRRIVQVKLRTRYLERFEEFIGDADDKIEKALEAIADNQFAAEIVFESKKAEDPRSQSVIKSFQAAIDITNDSLKKTRYKRQAAVELKHLVDTNEKILGIQLLQLFDQMVGQ